MLEINILIVLKINNVIINYVVIVIIFIIFKK